MSQRTETAYKAEPLGESAQHDEARPEIWGRVNAVVVRPNEVTKCPWGAGAVTVLAMGSKTVIDVLGYAPRTAEDMTKKLLDMRKLERLGQGCATRYRVID